MLLREIPTISKFIQRFSSETATTKLQMDKIRARSLLKYTYVYDPPHDVETIIAAKAKEHQFTFNSEDFKDTSIMELDKKEKLLLELGKDLKHFVPNSQLHKIKNFGDLLDFYAKPVNNITKYAEIARDERLPKNMAVLEHPKRFHPNDISATHGGVTAFPGDGGRVFGIRTSRLYREFKPKKEWYDYEEQNFNYDDISKGMPWDPEIARKMDSQSDIRFTKNHLMKKIK